MSLRNSPGKSGRAPLRQASGKRDRSVVSIVVAAGALLALLGGAIGAYLYTRASYVATSSETLCPTERPPAEVVALILDMSDRLTEVQLLSVRNHLTRLLQNELPRFAFVEVYTVQDQASAVAEPVIGLCNPGKGSDLNRVYQNPELARKRWEQDFAAVLAAKLDELMAAPESARSPIYEAVQAVAVRAFGKPQFDGVPKRLVVVSDLLQNVPEKGGSHYRGVPDFGEFRASAYFSQVRADLRDVHVYLYYMNRSDHRIQGAEHIRFWEDYFGAQGAQVMAVERIFGD